MTLREFRESLGLSMAEFGAALNRSGQQVHHWEIGRNVATVDVIPLFTKAFNVTVERAAALLLSDPIAVAARHHGVSRDVAEAIFNDVSAQRHAMNVANRDQAIANIGLVR